MPEYTMQFDPDEPSFAGARSLGEALDDLWISETVMACTRMP
jgi:hypothetical protein